MKCESENQEIKENHSGRRTVVMQGEITFPIMNMVMKEKITMHRQEIMILHMIIQNSSDVFLEEVIEFRDKDGRSKVTQSTVLIITCSEPTKSGSNSMNLF